MTEIGHAGQKQLLPLRQVMLLVVGTVHLSESPARFVRKQQHHQ